MLLTFFYSILGIFLYMSVFYMIALKLKDNSIADIGWGIGFVIIALLNLFLAEQIYMRQLIITGLVAIWGIRLALHIYLRRRGKSEDFRYAAMRKSMCRYEMYKGISLLVAMND